MIAGLLCALVVAPSSTLLTGGTVFVGDGKPGIIQDVRLRGDRIEAIGRLKPLAGETVISVKGLVVSPGFIDSHSHADSGFDQTPMLESQVRQGITTAVVGQDGGRRAPIVEFFQLVRQVKPTLNFASFSGHGGLRTAVMGKDYERESRPEELAKMVELLDSDMKAGAIGLSSGLEYDPGIYSNADELIGLAKVVAKHKGMYISHVRDEGRGAKKAFEELERISATAGIQGQISHIKLAAAGVWNQSAETLAWMKAARKAGNKVTADVYPYLYWQSTITAMTVSRDFENLDVWRDALADVGGGQNVLLTRYTPDPLWIGRTVADIAKLTSKSEEEVIRDIVRATREGRGESVVVTAMNEDDLRNWLRDPFVSICSDGADGGTHPRGAGSFPRVLGRYVRDQKVLPLGEAIRKMTSLPATNFKLAKRGSIQKGWFADVVIFDPKTIQDKATPQEPKTFSEGIVHLFVNGKQVLKSGKMTGERPGRAIPRG